MENCIKNFASPEVLRGQNQRFCKNCQRQTDSTRYTKLIKEPDILICHLVRSVPNPNLSIADKKKHNALIVKYDSKIKFGKIFNSSSEFPEDVAGNPDNKDLKAEEFDLHIKNDPD